MLVLLPKVSMLYSGLLGIMYFLLTAMVIRQRALTKTGIGHAPDPSSPLFRAVRIHGNFSEFVPFILFLMALDEMSGRNQLIIHVFGFALLIARMCHYLGIKKSDKGSYERLIGAASTFTILITLSVLLVIKGILL
jgi:uncharacterized membrane protein YecN with MAPEG domain